jgi:hypothetical protein
MKAEVGRRHSADIFKLPSLLNNKVSYYTTTTAEVQAFKNCGHPTKHFLLLSNNFLRSTELTPVNNSAAGMTDVKARIFNAVRMPLRLRRRGSHILSRKSADRWW